MGVHGLWDLLAPVGRRVSVETLAGRKLAIDASIWIVQFMKAMRDEKGEMVRNAHVLGFFRRICKLLYLKTRPVFVFDGGTPALKRRTVIARRRQRENAQAKIRKTAEKLLLNQLKAMRLKELARDLENQRKMQKNDANDKKNLSDQPLPAYRESNDKLSERYNHENLDEMLAASIAAEEDGNLIRDFSTSAAAFTDAEEDNDGDEELIVPAFGGKLDPDVLAALPPSIQLDLLMRENSLAEDKKNNKKIKKDTGNQDEKHKNNAKGKEILSVQTDMEGSDLERNVVGEICNQENLDEMLAASMVAEEDRIFAENASTSASGNPYANKDRDGDGDEEMILPEMHGKIDPSVLAALPPSMQLDLLVQIRERLMAENRHRYQKVKKAPEKFSELQIQSYLKTVAFRREINQVQKAAAGKGVGGVQTSRIASEANREFIFSSSFTGDKQLLTSAGLQRNGDKQQDTLAEKPSSGSLDTIASISESNVVQDESRRVIDDDVETYVDERGHIRVSRVRAMGMRMTRDLQRNLDLMKEIEQEKAHAIKSATGQSVPNREAINQPKSFPGKSNHVKSSHENSIDSVKLNDTGQSLNNKTPIQISFEVGENDCFESDDDIFASLVAGQSVKISSADDNTSRKQSSDLSSDSDWEEGFIEEKGNSSTDVDLGTKSSIKESIISDVSEVEWEEGACDVHENSLCATETEKPVSRGYLEEEADLQEAIRRSLEDAGGKKVNALLEHKKLKISGENANKGAELLDQEDGVSGSTMLGKDVTEQNMSVSESLQAEKLDDVGQSNVQAFSSLENSKLNSSEAPNPGHMELLINKSGVKSFDSICIKSRHLMNRDLNLHKEKPSSNSVVSVKAKEINLTNEQSSDTFADNAELSISAETCLGYGSRMFKAECNDMPYGTHAHGNRLDMETEPSLLVNEEKICYEAEPSGHWVDMINPSTACMDSSARDSTNGMDLEQKLAGRKGPDDQVSERERSMENCILMDNESQFDFAEASLEEEMSMLGQERINLGDEQRKLERNAESVSSEMFAECQELLQMFGLPYIIAPMEAEAQCAYLELANLVDGVVTDDSDVFLFGAKNVYKNIFDDCKYVETYFMKDIEKELGLTREKLIQMALLLGSDYTEGVSGIGIVNAIEVVNAFPEEDGLHKFREWVDSPDPTILGRFDAQTGSSVKKKGSKGGDSDLNHTNSNIEAKTSSDLNINEVHAESHSTFDEIKHMFMDKHRNVSKNWHLPSSFPSETVIAAYSCPQVDKSTEPFTWGKPDLHVLHKLCWEKFGWNIQKSDELLLPVLKEYEKRETQLRLEAFYTFNERFAKIRSKRIKKAVKVITGNQSTVLMNNAEEEVSKSRKKGRISRVESGDEGPHKSTKRLKENAPGNKDNNMEKSTPKQSRKRRIIGKSALSEVENPEKQWREKGTQDSTKGSRKNGGGSGRGQGKGKGRGKQSLGSSSDHAKSGDEEQEAHVENSEGPQEVRRSARSRRPVSYIVDDLEINDAEMRQHQGDVEKQSEEAAEQVCFSQGICRDVAASPNSKEQHKLEDPSYMEDLSVDYLEGGGGFCTDEVEVGQPGVSQNSHPTKADASTDYLKMGGGFCMEEGDKDVTCCPPTAAVWETANSLHCSSFVEEAEYGNSAAQSISGNKRTNASDSEMNEESINATYPVDHSKVSISLPKSIDGKENTGASNVEGLSAMPALRRKRRKR